MNTRLIANILELIVGIVLMILSKRGTLDEYWGGMGTALIFISFIMLIRQIRYKSDKDYKAEVDVKTNDERNKYLRVKAWSWAGYLFVIISAVATIVLRIAGYDQYSMMAGASVCLIMVLYWVSYILLSRKY